MPCAKPTAIYSVPLLDNPSESVKLILKAMLQRGFA